MWSYPSTHQKRILRWRMGELTPTLPHLSLRSAVLVFGATVWEPSTLQPRIPQNTAQLREATRLAPSFCGWVAPGVCSARSVQPYAVAALLTLRPSGISQSLGTPAPPLKHPPLSEASLQMLPDPPLSSYSPPWTCSKCAEYTQPSLSSETPSGL